MLLDLLFNYNEGLWTFLLGLIIGAILLYIANQMPRELGIQSTFRLFGFISIIGTLSYWIFLSLSSNVIEIISRNKKVSLVVLFVFVITIYIFKEELFSGSKRRR